MTKINNSQNEDRQFSSMQREKKTVRQIVSNAIHSKFMTLDQNRMDLQIELKKKLIETRQMTRIFFRSKCVFFLFYTALRSADNLFRRFFFYHRRLHTRGIRCRSLCCVCVFVYFSAASSSSPSSS